ncbi:TadG family pilus assembly protein [Paraburkholderia tagetis]|uniref:Pilus assembly protein TadG-related protein n=1 Tax=Paraburkholderia tagetis TaxID=2913261 RepID=A0A9X1UHB8_9BURK|nr:TadG family pilus assembly protein [Paraburkholderia tagetis]MCG5073928.1 pilus assembly protein TadG-related protein [Paraburkholderia tagetis]
MIAVIGLLVAVAALGVLDVANLYLAKRSLQNVADLAALAAAQQMDDPCSQPLVTASANAASNGFVASGTTRTLAVTCGRWDSNGNGGMTFVSNGTPPLNGVQVSVTNTVPYFFLGPAHRIAASATAKASVIGSFQVGTSLAQVNLLNGMLGALLGGTQVQLDAASWNGLANANVKVADLAAVATAAGTYDGLLATQATVGDLATILLNAVGRDGALTADVSAATSGLKAVAALVPQGTLKPIQLAALSGSPALLQLGVANAEYAADASVNVLQMLIAGAEIAAAGNAPVTFNLDTTGLSGVLPVSVALTLQVISPPSIAVGEPGYIEGTSTWRTQAQTAQILLGANATISTTNTTTSWLGIPYVLDVSVQLPLYVVAAQGQAWLQSAQCAASKAASTQTIGVQTGLANICIGTPLANGVSATDVSGFSCSSTNARWSVASVSLLNTPIATVSAPSVGVPVVNPSSATLMFDGNGNPINGNSVNSNALGAVLDNSLQSTVTTLGQLTESNNGLKLTLLSGALDLLLGSVIGGAVGGLVDGLVMPVVTGVLGNTLGPVLKGLDDIILGPLLQLLGVQLGVATVTDYPLTCGVATLVQ